MITLRPLHDRILIRRDEADAVTRGGIILPDGALKDRPQRGTVLAVGPGKRLLTVMGTIYVDPIRVQAGQEVLFTKYAGEGIKIDDEEYFLVREEDLIAVIEPDPPAGDGSAEELLAGLAVAS